MMLTANAAVGLTKDADLLCGPFRPLADVAELQFAGAARLHVGGKADICGHSIIARNIQRSSHSKWASHPFLLQHFVVA
jgi:hypothetical protein